LRFGTIERCNAAAAVRAAAAESSHLHRSPCVLPLRQNARASDRRGSMHGPVIAKNAGTQTLGDDRNE
jgi:hypothetical protein